MSIEGPAGKLEIQVDDAPQAGNITAILCHPHPQYGGSMHDAVVGTATEVLLDHGIGCVRFNFRGVGGSEGRFDNGVGEVEDLLAVVDWQRQTHPEHSLWLAGYSFGSNIVWRSLDRAKPAFALLIAPPVGLMDYSGEKTDVPVAAIAGNRDDFVDAEKFQQWLGDQAYLIEGADHFFGGYHRNLADLVAQIVAAQLC